MKKLEDILVNAVEKKQGYKNVKPAKGLRNSPGSGHGIFNRLALLYKNMEDAYRLTAQAAGLSCKDCGDNCCTSFFQHHTYIEWAYLWRGLQELSAGRRKSFVKKAEEYVESARQSLAAGQLPTDMCPLNEKGLCALYSHRLMICRLHGTRNLFTLPDGRRQFFPGCSRFAALPCARPGMEDKCPTLDRTALYQELASLEHEYLKRARRTMPRVGMTLAEMITVGPPDLG